MPPRPQSSSYPKFDLADLNAQSQDSDITPKRNKSDPTKPHASMQNLRGAFLSKEERERQGLGKKKVEIEEKKKDGVMRSASLPTVPLKSALKPTRPLIDRVSNSEPLPQDKETLTGLLNHHSSQLQHLADRAELMNEWIDLDTIVYTRLASDAKAAETARLQTLASNCGHPTLSADVVVDIPVTEGMREMQERIAYDRRGLKDLERAVFWQREELRRVEKQMGRVKSKQSGALTVRNVSYADEGADDNNKDPGTGAATASASASGGLATLNAGPSVAESLGGLFAGMELSPDADEAALHAQLAVLEANLQAENRAKEQEQQGKSENAAGSKAADNNGGRDSEDADDEQEQVKSKAAGVGNKELPLHKDFALQRWSRQSQGRLPTQEEWEGLFGKGVSLSLRF